MSDGLSTIFSLVIKVFLVMLFFVILLSFMSFGMMNIANYRQKSNYQKLAEACANYGYNNNGFTMYGSGSFLGYLNEILGDGENSMIPIEYPCVLEVGVGQIGSGMLTNPTEDDLNNINNYSSVAKIYIKPGEAITASSITNSGTSNALTGKEAIISSGEDSSGQRTGVYIVRLIPFYKNVNTLGRLFGNNPSEEQFPDSVSDIEISSNSGDTTLYYFDSGNGERISHLYVGREIVINGKVTNYIRQYRQ